MTREEMDEGLSGLVDGEIADAQAVLTALADPRALASLRAFVELRVHVQATEGPAVAMAEAIEGRVRGGVAPRRRAVWIAAASVLLALGLGSALGWLGARRERPEPPRSEGPPKPDLVVELDRVDDGGGR